MMSQVKVLTERNYRKPLQSYCKLHSVFDRRLNGKLEPAERPHSGWVFTGLSSDGQNDLIDGLDDII